MTRALFLVLVAASCVLAQEKGAPDIGAQDKGMQEKGDVFYQTAGQVAVASGAFGGVSRPVVGAPYSATTTSEQEVSQCIPQASSFCSRAVPVWESTATSGSACSSPSLASASSAAVATA